MKKNFSFFYARGGSGYIRGKQMAQYLGGKENPTEGYENDICIYVKVHPPDSHPLHSYLDVDDSGVAVLHVKTHPELGVIAISEIAKDYLEEFLGRRDVVFIPHQHCNFERRVRPDRPVKTVGIIGSKVTAFEYPIQPFREKLAKMGLELKFEEDYWNTYKTNEKQEMRLNVADFYYSIDIQVGFRPKPIYWIRDHLQNPNKLGNSSSFGIPMVAYPEPSYEREWDGCYVPARTIEEMLAQIKRLKDDPVFYKEIADRALKRSENYHIDQVAKRYLKLK
jgi:glycosyltransferase involved in cell wall biosynthesis